MYYGFYNTPFGACCMAFTTAGLFALIFSKDRAMALADLQKRFPAERFEEAHKQAKLLGDKIFKKKESVRLCMQGSPFRLSVWKALQKIAEGETRTYARIAVEIGKPAAVRAVATAIGANPIAYLIPCHRVIRSDGSLGGYRWGLEIKQAMLKAEGVNINP